MLCCVEPSQIVHIVFVMSIDMNINIKVDEEYLDIDIYTSTVCAFGVCQILLQIADTICTRCKKIYKYLDATYISKYL